MDVMQENTQIDKSNPKTALRGKNTLITGASSGIGFELAKLAAGQGANIIAAARDGERLSRAVSELRKAYPHVRVDLIACDLGQPQAAEELVALLESSGAQIDVLINDAGFGDGRTLIETPPQILSEMIETNVRNLTVLTRLLLPAMVERGYGRILNLASTGAFIPGPHLAVYCATKAFVLSFSQAVWKELEGTGVTATALCPGGTDTDFARVAKMQDTLLFRHLVMPPDKVARIGMEAMISGRRQVTAGAFNRLHTFLTRFSPIGLTLNIAERVLRHRDGKS